MNNKKLITGLHHVTAMTSDSQRNVDFYTGILGMRMVKKTVNFDAPDVYHFYYGNEMGDPGTILTFFPFEGMRRGRKGRGQVTVTSFSIPENAVGYWMGRFDKFRVTYSRVYDRFDETVIYFEDFDGLGLELVANSLDERPGFTYGHIPLDFSIRGFHSVTLGEGSSKTAEFLISQMDHSLIEEKGDRARFSASGRSDYVDILISADSQRGLGGAGTVHHVAFATADDGTQEELRSRLLNSGMADPTTIIDRQYFHSVYFREPGGVLFESATSDSGFAIDEDPERLGETLKLPAWEEKNRSIIESHLPVIEINTDKFSDYAYIQGH